MSVGLPSRRAEDRFEADWSAHRVRAPAKSGFRRRGVRGQRRLDHGQTVTVSLVNPAVLGDRLLGPAATPAHPRVDRCTLLVAASVRDARRSLRSAVELALRLGLPVAVLFVAVNPVWGFTWYFNTESWATGVYQKLTELRVDRWRASMIEAVASAYDGPGDALFRVTPPDIEDGDFSFIVIGDPGEGDASQYALVERLIDISRRADIKFLVVASDVVYPAGAMADYEYNSYMPFKGFTKPIYALPGNHDWFDALEGFNANFLEPKAARAAISARASADLNLTSTDKQRIDRLLQKAQKLRELYGIGLSQHRRRSCLAGAHSGEDLGLLSEPGGDSHQAGCRDASLEAAVLAMDQALRCLAGLDRDVVGDVRLQPRAVLPEFHGDPR